MEMKQSGGILIRDHNTAQITVLSMQGNVHTKGDRKKEKKSFGGEW